MALRAASLLAVALSALVGSQSVDPNTIPASTRGNWCTNQQASCPLICLQFADGQPTTNDCDPDTLAFTCVCSDGLSPNASEYSQTIPYFQCTAFVQQCIGNCGSSDNACVTSCRTATPCGAQNPTRVNATTTSSSTATASDTASATGADASATGDGDSEPEATAVYTGFGGAPAATSGSAASSLRPTALVFGSAERCGLAIILASFFVGVAAVL